MATVAQTEKPNKTFNCTLYDELGVLCKLDHVIYFIQKRTETGESTRPPRPVRQLWPATLAGPSHEAYAGGRRQGDITCHARPTHDSKDANFIPLGRNGPR